MAATWLCPTCQRRVPLREAACFCGCPREQAEREQREQRQRSPAQPTRELALMLVLIGLLGWVLARQRAAPPREPDAVTVAAPRRVPPPSPPPQEASPTPSASVLEPATAPAAEPPPAAPTAGATAVPLPEATPASDLARQELRAAYAALAPEAQRLERVLPDYRQFCLGAHVGVVIANCDQVQGWVTESARRIQEGLATAEERARRARVLPGDVRALREELGVARWEELAAHAQSPR